MLFDALHALKCKNFMFLRVFALKCRNFFLKNFCSYQDSKIVISSEYMKILHVSLSTSAMFDKKQDKTYNRHKETTGCGKPVLLIVQKLERNRLTARRFFSCRNYLRYVRISTTRVAKAIIRDNASKTVITSPPLAREQENRLPVASKCIIT